MSKIYYSQADSRWANHPYPSPSYPKATIKSSGCGVTCGAMIISSSKEIVYPDFMGDLAKQNGYRVDGGTADGFFPFICNKWGLEIERIHSSYEAFERCKNGDFVLMVAGAGLWTTGGHFILAVGTRDDKIQIFDPYLYAGKFDTASRKGADVLVEGNSCYVQIDKFKAYSNIQRLWAIGIGDKSNTKEITEEIKSVRKIGDTVKINGVYTSSTSSKKLNPATKTGIITHITEGAPNPYLLNNGNIGWINESCIVKDDTIISHQLPEYKTGIVNVNSSLNVRSGPSTTYTKVGSLSRGASIKIYEEQNGWYRIGESQWVKSEYVSINGNTPKLTTTTKYVKVSSKLNIRSGPDIKSNVIGSLSNGTKVTVYEEQNGWSKIGSGKWVSSQYLTSGNNKTVGQTKKLANTTTLYSNSNLTGKTYVYKPNTAVIIKANINNKVDKIYVPATGRTAFCSNKVYM